MTSDAKPLEFRRIDALARIFRPDPTTTVGIGDDAAVLRGDGQAQVWTIDAAVEGVHFERSWLAPYDIGYRAFMAAASDVAAMGAEATQALCAWILPAGFPESELVLLAHGVEAASRLCACPVVGGNLSRGQQLSLTTTVLGRTPGACVLRSGGRAGHELFVSGPLGAARVGLEALRKGRTGEQLAPFVQAFRAPRARFDRSAELRAVASCAIDISDGLLPDLAHLCASSRVGACIELSAVPRRSDHDSVCESLALSPEDCVLAGGEDYELLFACAPDRAPSWAHRIGHLRDAAEGSVVLREDGKPYPAVTGFGHFDDGSSQD